jgi:SNF2 family DNA or RNA helicase
MAFKGKLYPFQEEAREKMTDRGRMLLAVVMGGGKTVITLNTLEHLIDIGEISRAAIVVPAALKYQWLREISKFTNSKAVVIDGNSKTRETLWRSALRAKYVVVNPETLINDVHLFNSLRFEAMVIDEATMIKSPRAKRSRLLKKLGKKCQYRFALTGQPIENKPEELFSIMEFVDANVLGKFDMFDKTFIVRDKFGRPLRYRNLNLLNKSMEKAMVRKNRKDIEDQLPKIISTVVPVQFDDKNVQAYRNISNDLLLQIQKAVNIHGKSFDLWTHYHGNAAAHEAQGQIMARLTILRMLCGNPMLVELSATQYANNNGDAGSRYAKEVMDMQWLTKPFNTPKMDVVIEYITDILNEDPNNKIVLFSFFKNNLKLLAERIKQQTSCVLFTGDMNASEKDVAKQMFTTDPNTRLFLSSDAGGYGVDLPQANYLISYDLPWSAGKLDQREARIIRLSSQHPHVTITSFVMKGSVEERQYEMLQQKRGINEAFIDKGYDTQGRFELTLSSLTDFLQHSEV